MRERVDDTGFGNIRVIQRPGFGYGVDAVLLAAFAAGETGACPAGRNDRIADLGTDCGIVAFIAAHKLPGTKILGIDKREEAIERAERACGMNGLADRVSFAVMDIKDITIRGEFDSVVSNPPYFRRGSALPSSSDDRYTARHETTADFSDFAEAASRMLRKGGSFYLVHRPDRLADVITGLRAAGLEPKELQMVTPSQGKPANIVLIRSVKGAGPELKILADVAVHNPDGSYTDVILRLYERNK